MDDIVVSKYTASAQADLTPYQPANWNDAIPVSTTQLAGTADHTYSGPYSSTQPLYFNWASANIGAATASGYTVHGEVTGTGGGSWDWTNLTTAQSQYTYLTNDQVVGPLSAGSHTFKVWVDYTGVISESNENNNYYERTITVGGTQAQADLTPYQLANWNDAIPISTTQLSGSDAHSDTGPYYNDQTLYFNWASANLGAATASGYTVHGEVTGTGGGSWDWTNITTAQNQCTFLTTDQAVGPLSADSHTFKMWVDYTGVVSESNENNNYYERTINVQQHVAAGEIHGALWNDLDGDGVWDAAELGLANWKIYIDQNGNGQWDSTEPYQLTDTNGNYAFLGLAAGTYLVGEVPQAGWTQTYPGTNGAFAAHATVVNVAPGVTSDAPDSGEQQAVEVGPVTSSDTGAATLPVLPRQYDLENLNGYLTEPATGDPWNIAQQYLADHAGQLGLTSGELANLTITDRYTDADTHITHIYLRQEYNGLEVSDANFVVNVTGDGRLINVAGGFVSNLNYAASAVQPRPQLTAAKALQALAAPLGLATDSTIATAAQGAALGVDQATTLEASQLSLDPIPADLQYVPDPDGGVVLAWDYVLRTPDGEHWYDVSADASTGKLLEASDWVDHASYNVFVRPTESPSDGSRSIVTDPQDPNASPYGWHDTNGSPGAEYTDTRGNNVFAQEDHAANNSNNGFRPDGGSTLNFNFPLDLTQSPTVYESAAITNLFYWNNLCHDIHEAYGFTEAAGNFQVDNYTGQGLGNDPVMADAQDGSGTDNANFATPPDGNSPRMQMYLWDLTTPYRDGDLDDQIMVHEYGHGVSNRLVGGPSNTDALTATQSAGMGEGWSDWWGLMFTQKSSDTQMAQYPVGTYVEGQPPSGGGIRRYPYSFDMTVDPLTYGDIRTNSEVHQEGEVWCAALWDMNWLLIDKYGFNANIASGYSPGMHGNILALKLVMDSLKLVPVNPTFLQARDAILLADQNLTGGANQTAIWTAFARRGMGYSANDGGDANSTNVTEAFNMPLPGIHRITLPTSSSVVTGVNFGNVIATTVTLVVSPAAVAEDGATNLTYTFTRSGTTSGASTVNFSVAGTADDATDYVLSGSGVSYNAAAYTGTVTILDGSSTATVTVDPSADGVVEPNETVVLTVTPGTGYTVGSPGVATGTILNDDTPPQVTGVFVSGTAWTSGFLHTVNPGPALGYAIPVGSGAQLLTLPWGNINQLKVVFNKNVVIDKSDLDLVGINVSQYDIADGTFAYDSTAFTATWTLPIGPPAVLLDNDKFLLELNADGADPIHDAAGNRLDGEWTNPTSTTQASSSTYPSGDGTPGGNFLLRFNVLPGDASQDSITGLADLNTLLTYYGKSGMTWTQGDFTGDGVVGLADLNTLLTYYGKTLPAGEPTPKLFPAGASWVAISVPTAGSSASALSVAPVTTLDMPATSPGAEAAVPAIAGASRSAPAYLVRELQPAALRSLPAQVSPSPSTVIATASPVVATALPVIATALPATPPGIPLTLHDFKPVVSEATAHWAGTGPDAAPAQKLAPEPSVLGDLSGSALGKAAGDRVDLDTNAAGDGWLVDSTPAWEEELTPAQNNQPLQAVDPRVVDRMDLSTVAEHELGPIAGFNDLDALTDDVVSGVLGTGIR